jgi:hypothetical protein
MLAALVKYGSLTERQEAAVRNAAAKSAVRKAQWAAERAERDANKADVEIDRIADVCVHVASGRDNLPHLKCLPLGDPQRTRAKDGAKAQYCKVQQANTSVLALCWWVLPDESIEFANIVREGEIKIVD